jgi:hypothetical protein
MSLSAGTWISVDNTNTDSPSISMDSSTQDTIESKLDKQIFYSSAEVVSRFFHEGDGGRYQLADSNDNSIAFLGAMQIHPAQLRLKRMPRI